MLKAQSLSGCQARFFCPQDAGLWASGGLFTRVGHQPYSAFQPPTLDTLLIFTGMSIPNLFKKKSAGRRITHGLFHSTSCTSFCCRTHTGRSASVFYAARRMARPPDLRVGHQRGIHTRAGACPLTVFSDRSRLPPRTFFLDLRRHLQVGLLNRDLPADRAGDLFLFIGHRPPGRYAQAAQGLKDHKLGVDHAA